MFDNEGEMFFTSDETVALTKEATSSVPERDG